MKTASNLKISKIAFRSGMLSSMKEKSSCREYVFTGDEISSEVLRIFKSDKIAELAGECGNPELASPIQYQWARTELDNGQSYEIEVRNLAVMIFSSNDEKIKRLFRFITNLEKHARSPV